MPRRRSNAPGPATEVEAPMQAKGNRRPRRRPVARHPGIYYRPQPGGKVAPPYEIRYLDSSGKRRWAVVHGSLDDAEAKRAELMLRRRRGERLEPLRQSFEEYAWAWLERQPVRERTREVHSWALREHLIPYFGRRRPDQITVDDVAAFIAAMRRKGLRGWTITTALGPLSKILAQAARQAEVRFLSQPSWPFEYAIAAVVEATDQPPDLGGYREAPAPRVLLVEGRQACYADSR